jgi:hypothetical protein
MGIINIIIDNEAGCKRGNTQSIERASGYRERFGCLPREGTRYPIISQDCFAPLYDQPCMTKLSPLAGKRDRFSRQYIFRAGKIAVIAGRLYQKSIRPSFFRACGIVAKPFKSRGLIKTKRQSLADFAFFSHKCVDSIGLRVL